MDKYIGFDVDDKKTILAGMTWLLFAHGYLEELVQDSA